MDPRRPKAGAVAIRGSKIIAVGSRRNVMRLRDRRTRLVDLDGRTMLPGFIDSHSHWLGDWEVGGHESPEAAAAVAISHGWTTISEHFASEERLEYMSQMDRDGTLPMWVNGWMPLNYRFDRFGDWYRSYGPGAQISRKVRVAGVKLFADGGHVGYMTDPYTVPPEPGVTNGDIFWTQEEINDTVIQVHSEGYRIAIHTIGDGGHDLVLNAFDSALGGGSNRPYRHRIEHLMAVRDDQIARIASLGLWASFQLTFLHSDWREEWEPPVGPDRVAWLGRWREILDAGIPSVGSTDSPWGYGTVGSSMKAVYQTVTRIGESALPPADWMLAQRIRVREALALITRRAAAGNFEEDRKGTITPGKLADLVVLTRNPLTVPVEKLPATKVAMTMVGGKVAYGHPRHSDLGAL